MKVSFLFGSGVSVPAGVPKMCEITDRIMSGDVPTSQPLPYDADATHGTTLRVLRWLEIQVKRRYSCERDRVVNYEDLYFLASQIHEDLRGNYDNPALRPLVEQAFDELLPAVPSAQGSIHEELAFLVEKVADHIRECVRAWLVVDLRQPEYLDFLADALAESRESGLDILTLNHDTVLEQYLRQKQIPYTDGFTTEPNAVGNRESKPELLDDLGCAVRILKLHGGLDWYRFGPTGAEPWIEEYLGIPAEFRPSQRDAQGRTHGNIGRLPAFLIGTSNKLWNYTDTAYLELYHRAFRIFEGTDVLVAIGYGFGDKGINKRITDWILKPQRRHLIVVDLDPINLRERARVSIREKWNDWIADKRLIPVKFDLAETLRWKSIRERIKLTLNG